MSIESAILGFVFDIDNFAKDKLVNDLNYPSVTEINDVVYCDENPEVMKADLLYNKDSKKYDKYPVILNIHGGGWIIGDKRNSRGMCLQMADGGAFVVNMNYGMPPKSQPLFEKHDPIVNHSKKYLWPYQVKCTFAALQWIVDNAEKYNLDLENVFVAGDSAGAHLAAVTETATVNPDYAEALGVKNPGIKLKGAMLFCGFYNLDEFWGLPMNSVPVARSMMQDLIGIKKVKNSPLYKYINPIPQFTEDMPATLIISGTNDVMTHGQSDMVEEQLRRLGVDTTRYNSKGVLSLHDYQILSFTVESHNCMKFVANWLDETVAK